MRSLVPATAAALTLVLVLLVAGGAHAQPASDVAEPKPPTVDVAPTARDPEIETRLRRIIIATEWFSDPQLRVQDGVVFLGGTTDTVEHRRWAGDLAGRTQDVVAVVNRIDVRTPEVLDWSPAVDELHSIGRSVVGGLPMLLFSVVVIVLSWLCARLAMAVGGRLLARRALAPLLRAVVTRVLGGGVMVIGFYVVFRVAGLTAVALSIVGGTGILGLILGIAFRDITENFLASVFLSLQPPFRTGDLIMIGEHVGYVERLTNRVTILISLDGNHIQIPNTTVYAATIRNFTSNPNRREDFVIGIGYDVAISEAQATALEVLSAHPAVLAEPEPWVLVESLGAATVNLRVYFWIDGHAHAWLKVKSSVIRLIKRAFQEAGISMPDEAREMVFPGGVPVHLVDDRQLPAGDRPRPGPAGRAPVSDTSAATTSAEGGLRSDASELRQQALQSRSPEGGEDLLSTRAPAS
ncbi:mechanosensitive ion channel family protein [soil metagenome]